ncbi:MAG: VOC family protein [Acidimicrobiales bacterium]|nr:VOC family protein [Acidimicrobiales bacterium]
MVERPLFDHVAIVVDSWRDGFSMLVDRLGGRWCRGGAAGDFAPCQFAFVDDMKVELLQPGEVEGFVERFLERQGPGAHHLTWHVPDLDDFIAGCDLLGLEVMPDHLDLPGRREAFVHPKVSGFGTLVQAIESDERYDEAQSHPPDIPLPTGEPMELVWVALAVPDLDLATAFFGRTVSGTRLASGRGWSIMTWERGRRLLFLDMGVRHLEGPGVDHLCFAPSGGAIPEVDQLLGVVDDLSIERTGVRYVVLDGSEADAAMRVRPQPESRG